MAFFDYPGSDGQSSTNPNTGIFLPDASEEELGILLRHCRRRRFSAGEALMSPGGTDRSLYLIVDGTAEVLAPMRGRRSGRSEHVATVEAGSILGEMSFFDHAGHSALVRATTSVEVLELDPAGFESLADESPALSRQILFDLGRILAERLRAAGHPLGA
jgi:CRP-like cAMP-binding protein